MISLREYMRPWNLKYKKFFPAQVAQVKINSFDLKFINPIWDWSKLQNSRCILLANTATQCGLHQQLEELQSLYNLYHDRGLVVISVPSNDFLNQEPLQGDDLITHCSLKYGTTFPILEKTHVVKDPIHPLFIWLNTLQKPQWNYQKYLFNAQGYCIATAGPRSSPFTLEEDIKEILGLSSKASPEKSSRGS